MSRLVNYLLQRLKSFSGRSIAWTGVRELTEISRGFYIIIHCSQAFAEMKNMSKKWLDCHRSHHGVKTL
jgi:hypothetical protein